MKIREKFSDADLERIKRAVTTAEDKISGEIVPVLVDRSGRYASTNYKAAIICASFAFIVLIILDRFAFSSASNALFYDPVFLFFVVALAGFAGGITPNFSEPVKRVLAGRVRMDVNSRQRAEAAFLEEEVFRTRQRTGIMIFISFFEHEVVVLADKGINDVVDQSKWDEIVNGLVEAIRDDKIVDGLEQAITRCGAVLLEKGFLKTADDVNELRDDLRLQ